MAVIMARLASSTTGAIGNNVSSKSKVINPRVVDDDDEEEDSCKAVAGRTLAGHGGKNAVQVAPMNNINQNATIIIMMIIAS
jgi:hypothetical protein